MTDESFDAQAATPSLGQLANALRWTPTPADIENIACITHEANRVVCAINEDWSQPSWEDAPEWQRESADAIIRQ